MLDKKTQVKISQGGIFDQHPETSIRYLVFALWNYVFFQRVSTTFRTSADKEP